MQPSLSILDDAARVPGPLLPTMEVELVRRSREACRARAKGNQLTYSPLEAEWQLQGPGASGRKDGRMTTP